MDLLPDRFAIAGMGGATAAAIAVIVMIFVMTLDYRETLPLTLTGSYPRSRPQNPDRG